MLIYRSKIIILFLLTVLQVSLEKREAFPLGTNFIMHLLQNSPDNWGMITLYTVKILCIGTDRSHQTVQTKIRLLLKKQSDQGLRCLPFHQHFLDALMQCSIFRTIMAIVCGVPNFRIFTVISCRCRTAFA